MAPLLPCHQEETPILTLIRTDRLTFCPALVAEAIEAIRGLLALLLALVLVLVAALAHVHDADAALEGAVAPVLALSLIHI